MRIPMRLLVLFFLLGVRAASAQHYFEARGADTKYRYLDWNYTFSKAVVVDCFYVGYWILINSTSNTSIP